MTRLPRRYSLLPALAAWGLASLAAAPLDDPGTAGNCPPPAARTEVDGTSRAMMVPLPGLPVSFALPRSADGSRRILILIKPPEKDEQDELLKEKVRQGLASGELERDLREAARNHDTSSRPDVDLPEPGAGAEALEKAIQAALAQFGVRLGGSATANGACPPPPPPAFTGLYQLVPGLHPELLLLRDNLPAGATALAALDLDGDGVDELLLEHDGTVAVLQPMDSGLMADSLPGGGLIPLVRDDRLRLRAEEPRDVLFPPEPVAVRSPLDDVEDVSPRRDRQGPGFIDMQSWRNPTHLRVTDLGALRLYGPDPATGVWSLQARVELPTRTLPDRDMLLLAGPEVRTIGRTPEGHLLLAAGPVPYGDQRLRTLVITLDSLQEPTLQDIWSRLAPGEVVAASGFLMLDGEPYLWVKTENPRQIEFFGDDETLRIYHLTLDRTRAGVRPVLSFAKMKPFQDTRKVSGLDTNGDGRDDLIFVARDHDDLILSAYLRRKDNRFATSSRQQVIPGGGIPREFGRDLDGDRLPDLLVETDSEVRIHSGLEQGSGGKKLALVSATPTWTASLRRSTRSSPDGVRCREMAVLADIDGDGRSERLCWGVDSQDRPYFKVLEFTSRQTSPAVP